MSNKTVMAGLVAGAMLVCGAATAFAADEKAYNDALAAAKAAQKAAAAEGAEWRDIGKTLKAADNAAKKGDFATAVKKADWAKVQGEMGLAQAKAQAGDVTPSYLK